MKYLHGTSQNACVVVKKIGIRTNLRIGRLPGSSCRPLMLRSCPRTICPSRWSWSNSLWRRISSWMEQYLLIRKKIPQNVKTFSNQIKQILRPVENVFFLWTRPYCRWRAVKFWPHGWFCNGICDLTPKTVPFHYLLRQARSYGELCTYCSRDQMLIVFTDGIHR